MKHAVVLLLVFFAGCQPGKKDSGKTQTVFETNAAAYLSRGGRQYEPISTKLDSVVTCFEWAGSRADRTMKYSKMWSDMSTSNKTAVRNIDSLHRAADSCLGVLRQIRAADRLDSVCFRYYTHRCQAGSSEQVFRFETDGRDNLLRINDAPVPNSFSSVK